MKLFRHRHLAAAMQVLTTFLFAYFSSGKCFSQTLDSNFVKKYSKENDVEAFSDWRSYRLRFLSSKHAVRKDFSLLSNSMLYSGVNVDYKWLTISYGFNVPGTARDKNSSHKDLFLQLEDIEHLIIWQAYFKKYNGLLERLNGDDQFNKYSSVHLFDIGGSLLLPLNHKLFSYNAAHYLNQQQLRSTGSMILSFNPFYHQVKLSGSMPEASDKKAINFLKSSPKWFTGAFSFGYTYNLLIDQGKWNLSPELDIGYGMSKGLKPSRQWRSGLQYNATLTFGYSSKLFYSYVTDFYHNFKNHFAQESVAELNSGMSFTCGYRIGNLKKKILNVL